MSAICRGCKAEMDSRRVSIQQLCLACLAELDKQQQLQQQTVMLIRCKVDESQIEMNVNTGDCRY